MLKTIRSADITVQLSQEAIEALSKSVNGDGGHQALLRKLQRQCNGGTLELYEDDLEKLRRYSEDYGDGGYQSRFKAILSCI